MNTAKWSQTTYKEEVDIFKYNSFKYQKQSLQSALSVPVLNLKLCKKIQNALKKLRGFLMWNRILQEIRVFGTNSHLFDSFGKYRIDLPRIIRLDKRQSELKTESLRMGSWVIYPDSNFSHIWNIIVIYLLVYTFTLLPWVIAFEEVALFNSWLCAEVLSDLICLIDIIVSFNTAYYDFLGRFITNKAKIAKNYLTGYFIIDCLSIFPFYLLENSKNSSSSEAIIRLMTIARVLRGSKLIKLVRSLKNSEKILKVINYFMIYRGFIRLFFLLFIIIVISHFTACMFYFLARVDDFGPKTWVSRNDLSDSDSGLKYLKSLYFIITILTTVGFGDIVPYTRNEIILCIIWMLFGIAFYSTLVSSISSLFSSIDSRRMAISENMNKLDEIAKFYSIKSDHISYVKLQAANTLTSNKKINEFQKSKILNEMPAKIQKKIIKKIYKKCVSNLKFLQDKDFSFLMDILPKFRYSEFEAKVLVYGKNDPADYVYFLLLGRVNYLLGKENLQFKSMVSGTYFGEIEVIMDTNRKFTTITETYSELLLMSSSAFKDILSKYPLVNNEVCMLAYKRDKANEKCYNQVVDLLDKVQIKKVSSYNKLAGKKKPNKSRRRSFFNLTQSWKQINMDKNVTEEIKDIKKHLNIIVEVFKSKSLI